MNNKMTKAQLIEVITEQEARLTKATDVYQGMKKLVNHQSKQLQHSQKLIAKLEHEINSLKANKYQRYNKPAAFTDLSYSKSTVEETAKQHNKNIIDSQPEDPNKVPYANEPTMSLTQLKTLCNMFAKFEEVKLGAPMTRAEAREEIKRLVILQKQRAFTFRKIPYNTDQVYDRYLGKYGHLFPEV